MAHSPHKRWKGCCIMCEFHTLRGQGKTQRMKFSQLRKLGVKRRDPNRRALAGE